MTRVGCAASPPGTSSTPAPTPATRHVTRDQRARCVHPDLMGFPQRLLGPDERLVLLLRPHVKALLRPLAVLLVTAPGGGFPDRHGADGRGVRVDALGGHGDRRAGDRPVGAVAVPGLVQHRLRDH